MRYKIINRKKLFATIAADIVGYIFFSPLKIFRKRDIINLDIKKILIIRTAYIGDIILTLPILKPLKLKYPNAKITFLTSSKAVEVLKTNPYVEEILTYDAFWFYPCGVKKNITNYLAFLKLLRSKQYDLVIEARADIRDIFFLTYLSKSHYRLSYNVGGGGYLLTHIVPYNQLKHKLEYHLDILRYLNCKVDNIEWDLYLTEDEEKKTEEKLTNKGIDFSKPLVVIHPGARLKLKCWTISGFATVADKLIDNFRAVIILTGSPDEVELVNKVVRLMKNKSFIFAGEISLRDMAAILKRCSLFICNDSSPLHIASVMKTPTVAIFGPSKNRETGPYDNIYKIVEKDFPCRYSCDENTCRHEVYNECMKTITPDDVYTAARELMMAKRVKTLHAHTS